MEFLLKWLALIGLQTVATMSPGPAFVLHVKSTMSYGRTYGIYTALGLAAGVGIYAFAVIAGLAVILASSEWALEFLRYAGAGYLIYIGFKALFSKTETRAQSTQTEQTQPNQNIPGKEKIKAFKIALITQLLNPKALVYFTAVFAQFITTSSPLWILILYGLSVTIVELLWWIALTFILTHDHVRTRFTKLSQGIERVCGGLLIALGVRLALSKIH